MRTLRRRLVALLFVAAATPAAAHVEFKEKAAAPGEVFRATLVVGHGCSGSPTVRLRVRTPAGVVVTKAEPPTGWTVETKIGVYDAPVTIARRTVSEGVVETVWSGRLDPHGHGAFTLDASVSDDAKAGERIFFPVVQECEKGVLRWIDPSEDGDSPAPSLLVAPRP
ncbi:YcnI family protein [Hansschlegelia sp. KR7-227]|uniref:YcnI family protein n=1 Tax=Hansschlegelia sp. KR7-227 TaxID=3400914 RepID=UPI003C0427E0